MNNEARQRLDELKQRLRDLQTVFEGQTDLTLARQADKKRHDYNTYHRVCAMYGLDIDPAVNNKIDMTPVEREAWDSLQDLKAVRRARALLRHR